MQLRLEHKAVQLISSPTGSSACADDDNCDYSFMPGKLSPSRHLRIGRSKAGLGLFTRVPIRKGQFIIRYTGRRIRTETADALEYRYLFEVNTRWTIDGATRRNTARYINHSCRPNAEVYLRGACHQDQGNQEHQGGRGNHLSLWAQLFRSFHQARRLQMPCLRAQEGEAKSRETGPSAQGACGETEDRSRNRDSYSLRGDICQHSATRHRTNDVERHADHQTAGRRLSDHSGAVRGRACLRSRSPQPCQTRAALVLTALTC